MSKKTNTTKPASTIGNAGKRMDEHLDTLGRNEVEKNMTDDQVIAARTAERASLLARVSGIPAPVAPAVTAAVEVAPGTSAAGIIDTLTAAARTSDAAATAEKRAQIESDTRPLVAEARALLQKHGVLKSQHLSSVAPVALADWNAVRAATPQNWIMVGDRMVSPTHDAIWRLSTASRAAYDALTSSFGDASASGRAVDPANLADVATAVERFLDAGELFDGPTGVVLPVFRRALSHLGWWIRKSAAIVAATEEGIKRFDVEVARFETVMADVTPADGVTLPHPTMMPVAKKATEYKQRFAAPFDPRTIMREEPEEPDSVTVTEVEGGFRTTGRPKGA